MTEARPQVLIKRLDESVPLPELRHEGDAGFDLRAAEQVSMRPGERCLIPTGIAVAIPAGFAGYVQPRSGLAITKGLGLVNSPGLIDSGYRGEINVIAINLDPEKSIHLDKGERIAQLVILAVPSVELAEVTTLPASERGEAGFGSTGTA